jgi:MSHA biogenesis protein MshG
MTVYAWRGRNARGELAQGKLDALSESGVAEQLLAIGVTPVDISPAPSKADTEGSGWWARLNREKVTMEDILIFSRQMFTLNKAGVPILRAFAGLQGSANKPAVVELIKDIRSSLDQGLELSSALARHPKNFSIFYISMIRVGEITGRLTEVFSRLSSHLEFEREVRERIKQVLRYPTFVFSALIIGLVVINIFVIPVFAKMFANFHAELPIYTRIILGFSGFMVAWWPLLLMAAIVGVMAIRVYLGTPEGRYQWDRRKLTLPIIGGIILNASLARFARSFALSSQSGVPLVQGLTVVAQSVENSYLGSQIEQMRDGIERGESITNCAAAAGVFTPLVLQMLAVGEETGELDALLFDIAEMYERDTDYKIKRLTATIEPVLLVIMAGLVLIMALGVFLPLWSMGQAATGKGGGI